MVACQLFDLGPMSALNFKFEKSRMYERYLQFQCARMTLVRYTEIRNYRTTSLLFIRHEMVTKKFAKSKNFVFIISEFAIVYEKTVYIIIFMLKLSKIKMSINDTISFRQ